jgi:hypothetical protein
VLNQGLKIEHYGVGEAVPVKVSVGVGVTVGDIVADGVKVGVGVLVSVGVMVGVGVNVIVGVSVGVGVGVGVIVGICRSSLILFSAYISSVEIKYRRRVIFPGGISLMSHS